MSLGDKVFKQKGESKMKKFKIKSGWSGNGLNYLEIGNKKYDDIDGEERIKEVILDIIKDLKYKFFTCFIDGVNAGGLRFKLEKGQWEKWFYFTSEKHWSFGEPVNLAYMTALAVKFIISSYEEAHIAFQNKLNEVSEIEISINDDLQNENEPMDGIYKDVVKIEKSHPTENLYKLKQDINNFYIKNNIKLSVMKIEDDKNFPLIYEFSILNLKDESIRIERLNATHMNIIPEIANSLIKDEKPEV